MKTLVLVEHEGGKVKDATLATVTAAGQLGEVHLLVAGQGVGGVAAAAAKIAGVGKVHVADDAAYGHNLAENVAPLAAGLMADHDVFIAPATTTAFPSSRSSTSSPVLPVGSRTRWPTATAPGAPLAGASCPDTSARASPSARMASSSRRRASRA